MPATPKEEILTNPALGSDRLMRVPEVAAYLGVKESWIYDNWKRQGIPFRRLGGQLRIRHTDLDDWFEEQPAA
jgi:excisionase family DNA binding protein